MNHFNHLCPEREVSCESTGSRVGTFISFFSPLCFPQATWRLMFPISLALPLWWSLPREDTPGTALPSASLREGLSPSLLPKAPLRTGTGGEGPSVGEGGNPASVLFPKLSHVGAEQKLNCFYHKVTQHAGEGIKMYNHVIRKRGSHLNYILQGILYVLGKLVIRMWISLKKKKGGGRDIHSRKQISLIGCSDIISTDTIYFLYSSRRYT